MPRKLILKKYYNNKGAFFLGESKNGFAISDHTDTSLPKQERFQKGSFTMTTVSSRAPRDEKNRGKN